MMMIFLLFYRIFRMVCFYNSGISNKKGGIQNEKNKHQ